MGIFLLVVTGVLECAGAAWSYYYGSHIGARLAFPLNSVLGIFPGLHRYHVHVTPSSIGWAWVALYVLIHFAPVYGYLKSITNKRLKVGRPGEREITVVDRIYRDLAAASPESGLKPVSHLTWPRSFVYAPGVADLRIFFLGSRLIIGEGLFTHRYLKPLLAQQLFAYNSGDVWLRAALDCLPPGALFVLPLGAVFGLPIGIGPVVTYLCWKKHWRDRVYAGDRFAARLGQREELIQALDDVIRPREQPKNVLLRESPYAAERIDWLMRLAPPGFQTRTSFAASGPPPPFRSASAASGPPPPFGNASTASGSPPPFGSASTASGPPPPFGSASTASGPPPSETASFGNTSSESEGPVFPKQRTSSEKTAFRGSTSSTTSQPRAEKMHTPEGAFSSSRRSASSSTSTSQPSNQSQKRRNEWNAMQSQSVTLILRFANSGWHVRWQTPNTEAFHAVLEELKDLLDLTERYWDPEAFEEKGGWWIAYGALSKVGHLFRNYQTVRDELEREHWKIYEQQRQEASKRAAQSEQKQQTQQPRREEKREEVKLPRTSQEAFRILSLEPPVSLTDVKRAYRRKAFRCHPDRGGSHAQMVVINAAFELAQKAAS
jgi:hypothetical protein